VRGVPNKDSAALLLVAAARLALVLRYEVLKQTYVRACLVSSSVDWIGVGGFCVENMGVGVAVG
jgi:hypothetical protein